MCGRYYVDETTANEIEKTVRKIRQTKPGGKPLPPGQSGSVIDPYRRMRYEFAGEASVDAASASPYMQTNGKDVHPSDLATIICGNLAEDIQIRTMRWGFPGSSLIINARAETLADRPMFRDSLLYRRCLVPAGKYYEWNHCREKVTLWRANEPVLYMAGLYNLYDGEERFVVITTSANASVSPVHHRMPLILDQADLEPWLLDTEAAVTLLEKIPDGLERTQEYEQMSFFRFL